jgi:hypothetical protein
MLFGCYRASEANDPKIFVAAAAAILEQYPPNIGHAVCSPIGGLPAALKWLPSIAEIREACDARQPPATLPGARKGNPIVNLQAEPWLRGARREMIDGRLMVPGPEVDRAWQRWLKNGCRHSA